MRIKVHSSGWPAWCKDDASRQHFIDEYKRREQIELDANQIAFNPGLRFISKICLNSLCKLRCEADNVAVSTGGKFGQRTKRTTHVYVTRLDEFYGYFRDPCIEIQTVRPVSDAMCLLSYRRKWDMEEAANEIGEVNCAIAALTTASARLELWKHMQKLGRRTIYVDTDSIFFKHSKTDDYEVRIQPMMMMRALFRLNKVVISVNSLTNWAPIAISVSSCQEDRNNIHT